MAWIQFYSAPPLPPKKIVRAKNRPKFFAIFDNFRLSSRISPERINISKIRKALENLQPLNNLGSSEIILTKLFQSTCREAGVIKYVQILKGPPQKIWEGIKIVQNFSRFLTTFDFDRKGSTYRKSEKLLKIYNPPTLYEKSWCSVIQKCKSY